MNFKAKFRKISTRNLYLASTVNKREGDGTVNPVLFRLKVVASSMDLLYILSTNRLEIIVNFVECFDAVNV